MDDDQSGLFDRTDDFRQLTPDEKRRRKERHDRWKRRRNLPADVLANLEEDERARLPLEIADYLSHRPGMTPRDPSTPL